MSNEFELWMPANANKQKRFTKDTSGNIVIRSVKRENYRIIYKLADL